MKLRNVTLICSALLTTLFLSCSEDIDSPITGDKVKANFKAGISASTRVGDVLWDINDAIGIAMLDRESRELSDVAFNLRYYTTTVSGDFTPATAGSIIYFPQNGDEVMFKAYYPFLQNLQRNMLIPVSVANQESLSAIDFMSAEHVSGFSKADPNVSLQFHHRLSKAIFKLTIADNVAGLLPEDVNLTVKGMKTTGVYDLMNERLIPDDNSVADINLPMRGSKAERTGIILPRPAGSGITFQLTSDNGSIFEADMADNLALDPGYKYTFNVTLEGTEMSLSVTVEDWVEGPTTSYDMLGITTPVGDSYGVVVGDQMNVYMQNGNEFEDFRTYTYGSNGKWTTPNPAYWDEITHDPINLRAALVPREPAKNNTQLPDILIANPLSVERNHGAEFVFNHAGSRVVVELQSNVFTQEDLDAATIVLPSYFVGGREEKGVFIPGTARGNITVDRTEPTDNFAIIQPQPVSPDAGLVEVMIGTKDFTARTTADGFLYEAGVAYKLIVTVNESDVAVSATVIDWKSTDPSSFEVLEVTAPVGSTSGVDVGARMTVYKKDGDLYNPWTTFTYVGNDVWNPDAPIHWSTVTDPSVDLRASLVAAPKLHNSQMDDLLIADDVNVMVGHGADFVLNHVAAKATAILVSDIFTEAELNNATITMPQYLIGGALANGQFVPGQAAADVIMAKVEPTTRATSTNTQVALFQPQTIAAGNNIFKVSIGGRDYWAKAPDAGFTYEAGVNYGITIHINDNTLTVSATVIDWTTQSLELNAFTIGTQLPGSSSGVNNGEQMDVFTGSETERNKLATFNYNLATDSWTSSPAVFWESITGTPTFYASIFRAAKLNDTQLDDYLIAAPLNPNEGDPLNFILRHPAAKVVIQLRSSDGTFTTGELAAMEMTLPNYLIGAIYNNGRFEIPDPTATGNIDIAVSNNTAQAIIRPQEALAGRTLVNVHNPATGRDYPVTHTSNISFAAGVATTLIIDMKKTTIGISANVIDWEEGSKINLVAPAITVSGSLGNTADFFKEKTIHGYILGSNFKHATFSYLEAPSGNGTYNWVGSEVLYWDDLKGQVLDVAGVYFPSGNVPSLNENVTVFTWNLPNNQISGYDNYDLLMSKFTVSAPTYVDFDFKHVLSKVRIKLESDEFTSDELLGANVVLNNFIIKGSASLSTATATGTNVRESVSTHTDVNGQEYSAMVMPQTISSGTTIASVELRSYPGQAFPAVLTSNLSFVAGKETVITINLKKTKVEISATLEEWSAGSTGSIVIQ